jgi:arginine exporter protein ArgO
VRPIIVVSGRHRPHEILLLAVSLVTGLVISGALGLVALAARAPQVEQAAMLLGAAALVWYAAAAGQLGWRGAFAGVVCAAWAGANVARALQIRADLRGDR